VVGIPERKASPSKRRTQIVVEGEKVREQLRGGIHKPILKDTPGIKKNIYSEK
jgi:hypothetical protein